jgi:hypothetical protein
MARPEFGDRGCRFQPVGEFCFAPSRTRGGEQFEKAGASEKIEVGGIGMVGIGESLAALSIPVPAIFKPGDSLFIKAYGARDAFGCALDSRLPPDENDEDNCRNDDPPEGKAVECVPDNSCGGQGNQEPQITDSDTPAREFFETLSSNG